MKYDEQRHILKTLNDLLPHCTLKTGIFDNPKRSIARCALNHAASYACEYCESRATMLTKPVQMTNNDKRNQIKAAIEILASRPGTSANNENSEALSLIHI